MDTSRKKPSPPKDFTHYEACGCRVTFIAASGYKTSRMLPGKDCIEHTHVDQTQARTDLVEHGRDAMITATATQAARDAYERERWLPVTTLKPLDSAPRHKPMNYVQAIQHARCLLYFHDFLSESENEKLKQRIGKWLDKNNVSLVPAKGAKGK